MASLDEPSQIVPLLGRPFENPLDHLIIKLRSPTQNPKIPPFGFTHYGVLIVGAEIQNPVISIKWPEECDLQLGIRGPFYYPSCALC